MCVHIHTYYVCTYVHSSEHKPLCLLAYFNMLTLKWRGEGCLVKKELKQEWDANTLCIPYISNPSLPACIVYDCREGQGGREGEREREEGRGGG